MRVRDIVIGVVLVTVAAAHRSEAQSAPAPVRLRVLPQTIRLIGPGETQRLAISAELADGSINDVTDKVTLSTSNPKVIGIRGAELSGLSNGTSTVRVRLGNLAATVPVVVKAATVPKPVSFLNDVVPTLSRLGCNSGPCHGAAQGKGGFRLSLRGYAPEADFVNITRQLAGRRISREAPEKSLLLRKPLMETPHRGGKLLSVGQREYKTLLRWLSEGAPGLVEKEAVLTSLELLPVAGSGGSIKLTPGARQRLLLRATYSDGASQDVTHRALFSTNDPAIATVSASGLVAMARAGETAIVAKYQDKLATIRFYSPFVNRLTANAYPSPANFIDEHVNAKLRQLNLAPSVGCSDEEFLRRAYIDVIGTLPTAEEARAFLDDQSRQKRERLVESLLERPEFGQIWALKYGDLFVLRKEYLGRKNATILQNWLAEQFNANRGWDKIATDVLTASGPVEERPGGLFYVSRAPQKPGSGYWIRGTEATSEMVAQVFLGSRIQCAKCHNHPTERTTQDDYYHFAALWQQVSGKGKNTDGIPEALDTSFNGDVRQPRTGTLMTPRPLDRSEFSFMKDEDRRLKAAEWIVKQDDFARAMVNRIWGRLFGTGIIEPIDDVRSTNPPTNEPLLNALCVEFRSTGFDIKKLVATIMRSRTYQRSAVAKKTNKNDTRYFSRYPARRLPAEELADALAQVTGVPDHYSQVPRGTRAIELADTEIPSILLDTFGRPPRVQPSDTERNCNPAIAQALALLNSQAVQEKLKSTEGALATLLTAKRTDREILETLFLSALARRPTSMEQTTLLDMVSKAPKREEALQDALWALLNSKEFMFNH